MNTLKKSLYEGYKAAAEMVIPDLQDSNFLQTGMLTKEEFTLSGNMLIKNDPSWEWVREGECLIKKHILCNKIQLEEDLNAEEDINVYNLKNDQIDNTIEKPSNIETNQSKSMYEDDDFLAGFEDDELLTDDISTVPNEYNDKNHYYNVSITYDKYYRTPRIWFEGMNAYNEYLSQEEIYSDFMIEYIKVSLTLEQHPILNLNCVSVHPCKHAFAMQKMFAFELEKKEPSEIKIEHYLVHFLKFASCVIPQLEFDKSVL